jgi:uncharacterized protein YcgI (DUF1989 family)
MSQPASSLSAEERLKARKPVPKPVPAYLPTAGSPLAVDKSLYEAIQQAPRVLIEEFTVPIRSGRAWEAPAGSIVSISTPEGPQVGMYRIFFNSKYCHIGNKLHMAHISINESAN